MNVVRYEPWNVLRRFNDEMSRVLDEGRGTMAGLPTDGSTIATSHWAPAVDIKEDEDRYVITADVPGVDPKDIEVTLDNGVLTVKGERRYEDEQDREGYRRVERLYGSFHRRFTLPDSADAEKVQASGKNGVLEVVIPKFEKAHPRRIEVH